MSAPLIGFGEGGFGGLPNVGPGPDYYLNLVTSQYTGSANMLAWLRVHLQYIDDAAQCLATFDAAFNLDTAVGVQLDALGVLIGVGRRVPFQPTGGVSPILDDKTYRTLLYAQRAANQWTGTIDSLQNVWQGLFSGGRIVIVDGQNMTATILLTGAFTSILTDLINNGMIVPRPQGVLYTYSFSTLPIFGFDSDTSLIAGFDHGHWS